MSNIERKYAYYDEGVLPAEGEYGITYLTLYSSGSGNVYDGWIYDPEDKIPVSVTERTFGFRNPDYPQYCWDDEVVVDLSNAQERQESSEFAQGRITSFNTNVSNRPIVLQDIDITGLTESEREAKATTVLFCAIPLVEDAYIQAEVEVQCKVNISPDNTTGMVRIEAFYILNDESDRTMRPNPVHTFAVATANERHTLPWLYWNPALKHDDHNYIGVKLICTGGTAEIGISDDLDYGDAMITLTSAGLTGDKIDPGKPLYIELFGLEEVPMNYHFNPSDYTVICTYDTGEVYEVTHLCDFSMDEGEKFVEPITILQATYCGLHASMQVMLGMIDYIEILGTDIFHGSYTLNLDDYTVMAYLDNGDAFDITTECTYTPAMGTTIIENTTLSAVYVDDHSSTVLTFEDSIDIEAIAVQNTSGTPGVQDIIYTLYADGYCEITGEISDSWEVTNSELAYVDDDSNDWGTYGLNTALGLYVFTVTGTSMNGSRSITSTTRAGYSKKLSSLQRLNNYCCIEMPASWTGLCKKVVYKVKGKPLWFAGCHDSNTTRDWFPNDCEFVGFDDMDTSKLVSLYAAFYAFSSVERRAPEALEFLNNMHFPALLEISETFQNCDISKLTYLDTESVVSMQNAFYNVDSDNTLLFKRLNTKSVKNMAGAFKRRTEKGMEYKIDNLDFVWYLDMINVRRANEMFLGWKNIDSINQFSSKRLRNLISCPNMFASCTNLYSIQGAIDRWENTKLKYASGMFYGCTKLQHVSGNLGFFISMADGCTINGMFNYCDLHSLIGLIGYVTSKIRNLSYFVANNPNLSSLAGCENWDTSNVITMNYLFYKANITANDLMPIANWNISKLVNVYMFLGTFYGKDPLMTVKEAENFFTAYWTGPNIEYESGAILGGGYALNYLWHNPDNPEQITRSTIIESSKFSRN